MQEEKIRLNKYMAQAGLCSRREADKLIGQGRVYVNGTVAGLGCLVGASDKVQIGKKEIKGAADKVLIAFYKPVGVTCTEKDRFADKKILDYVNTKTRVTYAGRLDKDSEGLMLLTNDGELIQKLMRGAEKQRKRSRLNFWRRWRAVFIWRSCIRQQDHARSRRRGNIHFGSF